MIGRRRYPVLFIAAFLPVCVMAHEPDEPVAASPSTLTAAQLAARARPSIVVITVPDRDGKEKHLGTGFIISDDGLIATNLHVVGLGRRITVRTSDERALNVTAVHASDRNLDLALLRVDTKGEKLTSLELGDSDQFKDGARAVVMGNPLGLKHSVVGGVVSGRREINGRDMLQLAMPIEPGNSGGPVLDMHGRVQGVVTLKSAVQANLGFAVAINILKPLIQRPNPVPIERWLTIGRIDPEQWTPKFGADWRQRGGRILVSGSGAGFGGRSLCLSSVKLPDRPFEIAVAVRLDDEAGAAGLVFHSDGGDKHYGFYPSAGRMRLSRFEGPTVFSWKVLDEVSTAHYRKGEWNHLKVRVADDNLQCFVNDQLVIQSNDVGFSQGRIGLAKFRATRASFKQFRVAKQVPSSQASDVDSKRIARVLDDLPPLASLEDQQLDPLSEAAVSSVSVIRQRAARLEQEAQQLKRLAADVHARAVATQLGKLVSEAPEDFDLLRAALLIARLDEEEVDIDAYVEQVDRMAAQIRDSLPKDADPAARLEALGNYLFKDNGFHGSRFDYYHRANSYMNRVIDDRVGLPITLSILYMELGRRLDLNIAGVGLPGHFIVQHLPADGEGQLIDVFNDAELLTHADAVALVRQYRGRDLVESDLAIAPRKAIVYRILLNLRGLAERNGDDEAVLRLLNTMLAVEPQSHSDRGMRAIIRHKTGRRTAAIADLDWFLQHEPAGLDLDAIRHLRDRFQSASD